MSYVLLISLGLILQLPFDRMQSVSSKWPARDVESTQTKCSSCDLHSCKKLHEKELKKQLEFITRIGVVTDHHLFPNGGKYYVTTYV